MRVRKTKKLTKLEAKHLRTLKEKGKKFFGRRCTVRVRKTNKLTKQKASLGRRVGW